MPANSFEQVKCTGLLSTLAVGPLDTRPSSHQGYQDHFICGQQLYCSSRWTLTEEVKFYFGQIFLMICLVSGELKWTVFIDLPILSVRSYCLYTNRQSICGHDHWEL